MTALREVLVLNPNTTASVTQLLRQHVQQELGPGFVVRATTARFGAPYIADEMSYAIAAHAVLDAFLPPRPGDGRGGGAPGSVLIGCFGDPGLFALREASSVPVTGLAEASFVEAARHGRFAVVTGGAKWEAMLRRLASSLGYERQLAGIHTVAATGAELAADPAGARVLLARACEEAARRFDAAAVIVGGAALAGFAAELQAACPVPLIDSVRAGARQAAVALER